MLSEALTARADFTRATKRVEIGKSYPLKALTRLTAECSGCGHTLPAVQDAYLDIDFEPDGPHEPITLTIASNAAFVPPVSGKLTRPRVNTTITPPSVADEAKRHGCTRFSGVLNDNPFDPVD